MSAPDGREAPRSRAGAPSPSSLSGAAEGLTGQVPGVAAGRSNVRREAGREGRLWPDAASQGRPPDGSGVRRESITYGRYLAGPSSRGIRSFVHLQ